MFNALTDMLDTPVTIKPFVSMNSAGDKTYGLPINAMACIEYKTQVVVTKQGKQEISDMSFYINGSQAISEEDVIRHNNKDYRIKGLLGHYDNGYVSLWVVQV